MKWYRCGSHVIGLVRALPYRPKYQRWIYAMSLLSKKHDIALGFPKPWTNSHASFSSVRLGNLDWDQRNILECIILRVQVRQHIWAWGGITTVADDAVGHASSHFLRSTPIRRICGWTIRPRLQSSVALLKPQRSPDLITLRR
jgi:hypothetical protein